MHSCRFVSVIRTFPLWSSWVAADHSFADYCQPFIRRLSTIRRSCIRVILFQSFAPFPFCHRGPPPTVHAQGIANHSLFQSFAPFPFGHRGSPPTVHSQVFYQPSADHAFASFCFSHSHLFLWSSWVAADHSFAGYCQPFIRWYLPFTGHAFASFCFSHSQLFLWSSRVAADCSFAGYANHSLFSIIHTFPLWSSWVAADRSFTGYCHPLICRLSTGHSQIMPSRRFVSVIRSFFPFRHRGSPPTVHSQAITNHSFTGFLSAICRSCIRVVLFQSLPIGHRGSPPTVHSQAITNHSFAGFSTGHSQIMHSRLFVSAIRSFSLWSLRVAADRSFTAYCQPFIVSIIRTFPLWSSRVAADHSFAGYCQPFIHTFSLWSSRVAADRSFTGYCQSFIVSIIRTFPLWSSRVAADRSFAAISSQAPTGYSFVLVFCPSSTGHCQTLYRRLLPIKPAAVTFSLYLTSKSH